MILSEFRYKVFGDDFYDMSPVSAYATVGSLLKGKEYKDVLIIVIRYRHYGQYLIDNSRSFGEIKTEIPYRIIRKNVNELFVEPIYKSSEEVVSKFSYSSNIGLIKASSISIKIKDSMQDHILELFSKYIEINQEERVLHDVFINDEVLIKNLKSYNTAKWHMAIALKGSLQKVELDFFKNLPRTVRKGDDIFSIRRVVSLEIMLDADNSEITYRGGDGRVLRDSSNGQFGSYPSFEGDDEYER